MAFVFVSESNTGLKIALKMMDVNEDKVITLEEFQLVKYYSQFLLRSCFAVTDYLRILIENFVSQTINKSESHS